MENGALCDTREEKILPIGPKNATPKKSDTKKRDPPFLFFLILFLKSNLRDDI